ncbi:uncharacterized protein LOC135804623 [Sycon ciliatum]|uniref:uncharacterized protein LOC135804623 n=1 Tax=Sycon ciliatum TaxID=27933 RepID=UPI0031F60804
MPAGCGGHWRISNLLLYAQRLHNYACIRHLSQLSKTARHRTRNFNLLPNSSPAHEPRYGPSIARYTTRGLCSIADETSTIVAASSTERSISNNSSTERSISNDSSTERSISDNSSGVDGVQMPQLRFESGAEYEEYFKSAVHALMNTNRDTDIVVVPKFISVNGLCLCSIPNGLEALKTLYPSHYNIVDHLVGETVYLVSNISDDEADSEEEARSFHSCRILVMPSLNPKQEEEEGEEHILLLEVEDPSLDTSTMPVGTEFTLMQHDQVAVTYSRMLDTLHDLTLLANRLDQPRGGHAETSRPLKISAPLYNSLLCRSSGDDAGQSQLDVGTELVAEESTGSDFMDGDLLAEGSTGNDVMDHGLVAEGLTGSEATDDELITLLSSKGACETGESQKKSQPRRVKIPENVVDTLNARQLDIVKKVFTQALTLIRGPPGSGKTTVAAAIVETALRDLDTRGVSRKTSKILVCASSNVAADNLCEKICRRGLRAVRINARSSELEREVPASLKPYCLEDIVLNMASDQALCSLLQRYYQEDQLTIDELDQLNLLRFTLESKVLRDMCDVVVATCATAADNRLERFLCPVVLIDEVTQSYEPETLIAIMSHAERVVLIGDPCQLGPIPVACPDYGYRLRSMYDRLILAGTPTEFLDTQFRMHPSLAEFSCRVFYDGKLCNGVSALDRTPSSPVFPWPSQEPLVFLHDPSQHHVVEHSCANDSQAKTVLDIINYMCQRRVEPSSIGVITPYSAQRALLKETLRSAQQAKLEQIEVCSVDEFQGREKDYIVVSSVRSTIGTGQETIGFLDNPRRLNVTLTRARYGMIVLGNAHLLSSCSPMWSDFLCDMRDKKCLVTGDDISTLAPMEDVPLKRHGFVFELSV